MSESELYKEGGTIISTSNVNKRNAELAQEYKRKMEAENAANMYDRAREQGKNDAYLDIAQRLSQASNQYTPIMEGSLADIQMQDDINRGINYQEPQEPGLLDAVSGRLGELADGASDWFNRRNEPVPIQEKSQLQKDQEFDQMQYESEQAGLAELEQLLNRQQR